MMKRQRTRLPRIGEGRPVSAEASLRMQRAKLLYAAEDASRPRRAFRVTVDNGMTVRLARNEPPTRFLFRGLRQ